MSRSSSFLEDDLNCRGDANQYRRQSLSVNGSGRESPFQAEELGRGKRRGNHQSGNDERHRDHGVSNDERAQNEEPTEVFADSKEKEAVLSRRQAIQTSLHRFIRGLHNYLSVDRAIDIITLLNIRQSFCSFMRILLYSLEKSTIAAVADDALRMDLYHLFVGMVPWTRSSSAGDIVTAPSSGLYQPSMWATNTSSAAYLQQQQQQQQQQQGVPVVMASSVGSRAQTPSFLFSHTAAPPVSDDTAASFSCSDDDVADTGNNVSLLYCRHMVEFEATGAIAGLCRGKHAFHDPLVLEDVKQLWLRVLEQGGECYHESVAQALYNLMRDSPKDAMISAWVLRLCYSGASPQTRSVAFSALCEVIKASDTASYPLTPIQLTCVALFALSDSTISTRRHAQLLLQTVLDDEYWDFTAVHSIVSAEATTPLVHRECQVDLSRRLAERFPHRAYDIVFELMHRFDTGASPIRSTLLMLMHPWLSHMGQDSLGATSKHIDTIFTADDVHVFQTLVIRNLFAMHQQFEESMMIEFSEAWTALAVDSQLLLPILDLLMREGAVRRVFSFLLCAQSVVMFLVRCLPQRTIRVLVHQACETETIFPRPDELVYMGRAVASQGTSSVIKGVVIHQFPFEQLFSKTHEPVHDGYNPPFLYLKQAVQHYTGFNWLKHSPGLLNACIVYLDHPDPTMHEHSKELLKHMLTVCMHAASVRVSQRVEELKARLDETQGPMWAYEDILPQVVSVRSEHELGAFVRKCCHILVEPFDAAMDDNGTDSFEEELGSAALRWATKCRTRHSASRAFQIIRYLDMTFSESSVTLMLSRLADVVEEPGTEQQAYAMDVLLAFRHIVHIFLMSLSKREVPSIETHYRRRTSGALVPEGGNVMLSAHMGTSSASSLSTITSAPIPIPRFPLHPAPTSPQLSMSPPPVTAFPFASAPHRGAGDGIKGSYHESAQSYRSGLLKRGTEQRASETEKRCADGGNGGDSEELYGPLFPRKKISKGALLPLLPRIFWTCVCLFDSTLVHEFRMAVSIATGIYQIPEFSGAMCQKLSRCIFDELDWKNFPGIHELVLKGVLNDELVAHVLPLLAELTRRLDDDIVDRRDSLSVNIAAVLPHLLEAFEPHTRDALSTQASAEISKALEPVNSRLSRLFSLYSSQRYPKGKDAWLADFAKFYAQAFFPSKYVLTFSFLLNLLEKGPSKYQLSVVSILTALLRSLRSSKMEEVASINTDLIAVIVRLQRQGLWDESFMLIDAASILSERIGSLAVENAAKGPSQVTASSTLAAADSDEQSIASFDSVEIHDVDEANHKTSFGSMPSHTTGEDSATVTDEGANEDQAATGHRNSLTATKSLPSPQLHESKSVGDNDTTPLGDADEQGSREAEEISGFDFDLADADASHASNASNSNGGNPIRNDDGASDTDGADGEDEDADGSFEEAGQGSTHATSSKRGQYLSVMGSEVASNHAVGTVDATRLAGNDKQAEASKSPKRTPRRSKSNSVSSSDIVGSVGAIALQASWNDTGSTRARAHLSGLLRLCGQKIPSTDSIVFESQPEGHASPPDAGRYCADVGDGKATNLHPSMSVGDGDDDELFAEFFSNFDFLDRELEEEQEEDDGGIRSGRKAAGKRETSQQQGGYSNSRESGSIAALRGNFMTSKAATPRSSESMFRKVSSSPDLNKGTLSSRSSKVSDVIHKFEVSRSHTASRVGEDAIGDEDMGFGSSDLTADGEAQRSMSALLQVQRTPRSSKNRPSGGTNPQLTVESARQDVVGQFEHTRDINSFSSVHDRYFHDDFGQAANRAQDIGRVTALFGANSTRDGSSGAHLCDGTSSFTMTGAEQSPPRSRFEEHAGRRSFKRGREITRRSASSHEEKSPVDSDAHKSPSSTTLVDQHLRAPGGPRGPASRRGGGLARSASIHGSPSHRSLEKVEEVHELEGKLSSHAMESSSKSSSNSARRSQSLMTSASLDEGSRDFHARGRQSSNNDLALSSTSRLALPARNLGSSKNSSVTDRHRPTSSSGSSSNAARNFLAERRPSLGWMSLSFSTRSLDTVGYDVPSSEYAQGSMGPLGRPFSGSSTGNTWKKFHACTLFTAVNSADLNREWSEHVSNVLDDDQGVVLVQLFPIFTAMCTHAQHSLVEVLSACRSLAAQFLPKLPAAPLASSAEALKSLQLPFVYVDTEVLASGKLLSQLRASVLQVDEMWRAFSVKKRDVESLLAAARQKQILIDKESSIDTMQSTRSRVVSQTREARDVDDVSAPELVYSVLVGLFRLQMLFAMVLRAYLQMIMQIERVNVASVHNISAVVGERMRAVYAVLVGNGGAIRPPRLDFSQLSKQRAIQSLQASVLDNQIEHALSRLAAFREFWKNDVFGNSSDDDLAVLTHLVAEHEGRKPGSFAIYPSATSILPIVDALQARATDAQRTLRSTGAE